MLVVTILYSLSLPQTRYSQVESLTYLHQFAVEHHVINSAIDAIVIKEEKELSAMDFKNDQVWNNVVIQFRLLEKLTCELNLLSWSTYSWAVTGLQHEPYDVSPQGLLCLKLMFRSQGWPWFISTLLPLLVDRLGSATEYGICRYKSTIALVHARYLY